MATEIFKHGVYYSETATSIVAPVKTGMPLVAIGTAPIHAATEPAPVNTPILCNSISEFIRYFGWSEDFANFTLCEAASAAFSLFNVAPIICVNVVKSSHSKSGTATASVISGRAVSNQPIILSSLKVKSDTSTLTAETDYTAKYVNGELEITIKNAGKVKNNTLTLEYSETDVTKVQESEIVSALEAIEDIYPRLGVIPGTIIAPKYSASTTVAAAMLAKTVAINGCFNSICAVDIDTSTVKKYDDVFGAKNGNNFVASNMIVCWPKVSLGGVQYHLSTQVAALMSLVDYENDNIPYVSPSNQNVRCDSAVLSDGTEVYLSKAAANYLNSIGVVTALNFTSWRAWGNRSSAYPAISDVKDTFIPLRRMMCWLGNTLVTTFFSKIDQSVNKRLIESVTDSVQIFLNGLAARGVILGGRIRFDETENPLTDLIDGKLRFNLSVGFCVPAEVIEFTVEFDPTYFSELFS